MEACEKSRGAIYVEYQQKTECLAYYVIGKLFGATNAIFFVGGDMRVEQHLERNAMFTAFAQIIGDAVYAFRDDGVPILVLARPGLYGSSGDHKLRHRRIEYEHVGQAIERLIAQYGLKNTALVGHSGGSSAIMGALSLGLKDGNCVLVASGGYDVLQLSVRKLEKDDTLLDKELKRQGKITFFSHHDSVGGISKLISRRIFLIGDPADRFAPLGQQLRYTELLQRAGHNARLIEAKSPRGDDHTFIYESLRAAAGCLRGDSDQRITRLFRTK